MKCDRFVGTGTGCITKQPECSGLRRLSGSCNNIKRAQQYQIRQKRPVLRTKSMVHTFVRHDSVKNTTSVVSHFNDFDETKVEFEEQDSHTSVGTPDKSNHNRTVIIERRHEERNDCLVGDREKIKEPNGDKISISRGKPRVNRFPLHLYLL